MKSSRLGPGQKSIARRSTFSAAPKPLKRSTPLKSDTGIDTRARRRNSTLNPGRGFAASAAQRDKIRGQVCTVTECFVEECDPAHLAPRALGRGCDAPECVIALCRRHHEMFDRGELDLLGDISGRGFEVELAHMQGHYSDPLSVVIRLSGMRWQPIETEN